MLPRVVVHTAVSADGRMDVFTPDVGLYYELVPQWHEDATLVGCSTLLNTFDAIPPEDDAAFESPQTDPDDRRSLLVVPDSRGRLRTWHHWRQQPYWRGCVALVSDSTPTDYLRYLKARHVDVIVAGAEHIDMHSALETLNARYRIKTVRVDSGGTLIGVLLRAGLVNELSILVHPTLVGGTSPRSFFRAPDLGGPDGLLKVHVLDVQRLRNDIVWVRYQVLRAQ